MLLPGMLKALGLSDRFSVRDESFTAFALAKGFGGAGVLEVVEDFDGDAYRAVYTVKLAGAVYALHAFQKKSRQGIKTSQADIEKVKTRLKLAMEIHAQRQVGKKKEKP